MSKKTPNQVLEAYRHRLNDRSDWLYEKIKLLREQKKPTGYEEEEFYAIRWALGFIASNKDLAIAYLTEYLRSK